jgi:hypothetical protein
MRGTLTCWPRKPPLPPDMRMLRHKLLALWRSRQRKRVRPLEALFDLPIFLSPF